MALLETKADVVPECYNVPSSSPLVERSVRSVTSTASLRSIRSLREIPLVDASYDGDYDTGPPEKGTALTSPYFTSPIQRRHHRHSSSHTRRGTIPNSELSLIGALSPRPIVGPIDSPWNSGAAGRSFRPDEAAIAELDFARTVEKNSIEDDAALFGGYLREPSRGMATEQETVHDEFNRDPQSDRAKNDISPAREADESIPFTRKEELSYLDLAERSHSQTTSAPKPRPSRQSALNEIYSDANETMESVDDSISPHIPYGQKVEHSSPRIMPVDSASAELRLMDDIATSAGALASMKDFIETWAPAAYYVVTAAAALQRDAAALAAALTSLVTPEGHKDPALFTNQFYQLREAYSSLLTMGDFTPVPYGQQGWTPASTRESSHGMLGGIHDNEQRGGDGDGGVNNWDDRQLVDSLMTLLRTSPGFIASAVSQMSLAELERFCAGSDESPLNVLFHGILGSSKTYRPRVFLEVLRTLDPEEERTKLLARSVLKRLSDLAVGNLSIAAKTKLERFLRRSLIPGQAAQDFGSILASCVPEELFVYIQGVFRLEYDLVHHQLVRDTLQLFVKQLLTTPHRYGVIEDVYLNDKLRLLLPALAKRLMPAVEQYMEHCKSQLPDEAEFKEFYKANELIAVKGGDIVLLYNSLLPARTGRPVSTVTLQSSDEDEWCLESIREDLVPVMQGLAHTTRVRHDGWQIFKVGEDALVTDLGSDMGLNTLDLRGSLGPRVQALCDAVARHDGPTLRQRLESARFDAELRGDHLGLLDLQDAEQLLTKEHVRAMDQMVTGVKLKCKMLRRMLERAAQDQRHEKERLSALLSILDAARAHMWYETEVRNGSAFFRAREFLQVLYPRAKEDEASLYGDLLQGCASNAPANAGGALRSSPSGLRSMTNGSTTSLGAFGLGFGFGIGGSASANGGGSGHDGAASHKSRRLSILSSHSVPDSPFLGKSVLGSEKMADKEVETVLLYLRRYKVRNMLQAEEKFTRALVEVANLARKLVDRDHLVSYTSFKRDRHYQSQHAQAQAQAQAGAQRQSKRSSHHHRRSSLGLFDFFDNSNNHNQPSLPLTLHTTTSTQFLCLTSSHESLRDARGANGHGNNANAGGNGPGGAGIPNGLGGANTHSFNESIGGVSGTGGPGSNSYLNSSASKKPLEKGVLPPRAPSIAEVQALILSDLGRDFMLKGSETDAYMQQTGRMLLEGDSNALQPLLDDISVASSPQQKLKAIEALVGYAHALKQRHQTSRVCRSDVIHELSRAIGREPGTLYRDLQVVSLLTNQALLSYNEAFEDCAEAARIVIDTVVVRSMDYATRFLRYYMESTSTTAPKMAMMGINDSVAIWAFCACQGNNSAQEKLAELYAKFTHLTLKLKPLTKPSTVLDGVDQEHVREAVSLHWMTLASRI